MSRNYQKGGNGSEPSATFAKKEEQPIKRDRIRGINAANYSGICCRRHTRKKVVATVSRHERACKRIGEPSVPFCERGGAAA